MKDLLIVFPERFRKILFPAPVHPAGFDFVVSCPDDDTWMISQSLDVINCLLPYVVKKLLSTGIHAAGKHKVMPDENAHLVTEFVEIVALVNASTPYAQHVHVRITNRLEQLTVFRSADASREAISRDPVTTLGENRNTVDDECKTFALLIRLLSQFKRSQTGTC